FIMPGGMLTVAGSVPRFRVQDVAQLSGPVVLDPEDTLVISSPRADALWGPAKVERGSIRRAVERGIGGRYRFESESTYVQIASPGPSYSQFTVTTYPDTNPTAFGTVWTRVGGRAFPAAKTVVIDSIVLDLAKRWVIRIPRPMDVLDSVFVRRVYAIAPEGDSAGAVRLSLRYEAGEVPPGVDEDSLEIYMSGGPVSVGGGEVAEIPSEYFLSRNYPNPFNPRTMIRFGLPAAADVMLRVYDILGREVAVLAEGFRDAGSYSVEWNGRTGEGVEAGSGVYFVRLEASGGAPGGGAVLLGKMILVR
ncbi:MAG: FlgD immunoglobulin-like domain containing protein, partial [Bacteroidota bacterium]